MNNKEYHVNYESGESRYGGGQGVDFMMVVEAVPATGETWEDAHLYCEVEVEDSDLDEYGEETSEADDKHYSELKQMVIEMAKRNGIDSNDLVFFRD